MDCRDAAEKERDTVISLRRHFHENPELSQKEFGTMDFIEKFLHELGIETVRVPHGGVFGFIDSGRPGWTTSVLIAAHGPGHSRRIGLFAV